MLSSQPPEPRRYLEFPHPLKIQCAHPPPGGIDRHRDPVECHSTPNFIYLLKSMKCYGRLTIVMIQLAYTCLYETRNFISSFLEDAQNKLNSEVFYKRVENVGRGGGVAALNLKSEAVCFYFQLLLQNCYFKVLRLNCLLTCSVFCKFTIPSKLI